MGAGAPLPAAPRLRARFDAVAPGGPGWASPFSGSLNHAHAVRASGCSGPVSPWPRCGSASGWGGLGGD